MKLYNSGEFRASKHWPYAIASGCVVYRTGEDGVEVLLLSRDFDHDYYSAGDTDKPSYHLPKGHVKIDETLQSAALRETQEELGADCAIQTYLGSIHHDFNHPKHRNTNDKVVHYFAAEWVNDVQKTDNEHDSREWVEIDEAIEHLGQPNPKGEDEIVKRLKKFLELT